jgi:hypothetical protein
MRPGVYYKYEKQASCLIHQVQDMHRDKFFHLQFLKGGDYYLTGYLTRGIQVNILPRQTISFDNKQTQGFHFFFP